MNCRRLDEVGERAGECEGEMGEDRRDERGSGSGLEVCVREEWVGGEQCRRVTSTKRKRKKRNDSSESQPTTSLLTSLTCHSALNSPQQPHQPLTSRLDPCSLHSINHSINRSASPDTDSICSSVRSASRYLFVISPQNTLALKDIKAQNNVMMAFITFESQTTTSSPSAGHSSTRKTSDAHNMSEVLHSTSQHL